MKTVFAQGCSPPRLSVCVCVCARVCACVCACMCACVCVCVQATDAASPVLQVPVAPTTSPSPGKPFREPCCITFPGGTQQPQRSDQGPETETAQHRAEVTEQRSKSELTAESLLRPAPPSPQEVPAASSIQQILLLQTADPDSRLELGCFPGRPGHTGMNLNVS